ncbi:nucleotidyltransferase domain-containing protein [soil metagenome]
MDTHRIEQAWRNSGVTVAYLFGSRAESSATERSDHDFAVLFDHDPSLRDVAALQATLSEIVAGPVDIVELARAPLELRANVVQSGRLIFSIDEPRRIDFETATRSRWFDYRPTMEWLTRAYLRRVAAEGL